jgi:hypothetical protein
MQPLVLAIEPDLRQAAIVKRIIREKVLADVTVVDSRDAALEAMRTMVPDVLLLSTLLSPRDEDELIAHLRTLQHAEHLQTHTIPQLASSIGPEDVKPSKGLLSAFRRKKGTAPPPSGCDPDLFADEIRTYLQRASEKKREVREAGPVDVASRPAAARPPSPAPVEAAAAVETDSGSAWSSPFEWRPSQSPTATVEAAAVAASAGPAIDETDDAIARPEPFVASEESFGATAEPVVANAEPSVARVDSWTAYLESPVASPQPPGEGPVDSIANSEILVPTAEPSVVSLEAQTQATEDLVAGPEFPAASRGFPRETPETLRVRAPLVLRNTHEWWYEDAAAPGVRPAAGFDVDPDRSAFAGATVHDAELQALLACLAVPATVAGISYAKGCRIRRVRLSAA